MLPIDYTVASLPPLSFGMPAGIGWEQFAAAAGRFAEPSPRWLSLETELRNAIAEARGGGRFKRPTNGCSLYWRGRIAACFQVADVMKRDELIDRVWWDAAGEMTDVTNPLGKGALETYAIRLKIALKRMMISADKGNEAFDRLTQETKR